MLLFDNIAVNMNRNNHCRTWWLIVAYTKLVFLMLLQQPVFENVRLLYTVNFHVRGWEMSKTKREWINPAAAPLQGSYGIVAVSQKYQNLKNRIRNELKRKEFRFWNCALRWLYEKDTTMSYIVQTIHVMQFILEFL